MLQHFGSHSKGKYWDPPALWKCGSIAYDMIPDTIKMLALPSLRLKRSINEELLVDHSSAPMPMHTPRRVDTDNEQIAFLKDALAFTEANIRAFDVKAQICGAAFILSLEPLWQILSAGCSLASRHPATLALAGVFVIAIGLFAFVLWPVRPRDTETPNAQGLFYIRPGVDFDPAAYIQRLRGLDVEAELVAENIKLSRIRAAKSQRLKAALLAAALFYAGALVALYIVRC